jgi:hypothetical protein
MAIGVEIERHPIQPQALGHLGALGGALGEVLSQISILEAKSENRVSAIQWLTDSQTLKKANLRQNPHKMRLKTR